mgnify:CR=1 FL=1
MKWTDLWLRMRALANRRRAESEMDEELSFHLEMEARKNRAKGMAESDARRAARIEFGGVEQVREECREARGTSFIDNLVRDATYGARVLRKTPVFTAMAVMSLAIGIGANTAIFSLLDTLLLKTLPVRNPEQLILARWGAEKRLDMSTSFSTNGGDGKGFWTNVFSWTSFTGIRSDATTLADVAGFSSIGRANVSGNGQALATGGMFVSGNYYSTLGVVPLLGRAISSDDDTTEGLPSAVISYRFWERMFALDPGAIGKTLYVNGEPCVVVGVAPKEFFGISAGALYRTTDDITLPIRAKERLIVGRKRLSWFGDDFFWIQILGRRKPGVSDDAVRSELARLHLANLSESKQRQMGADLPRIYVDEARRGLGSARDAYRRPLMVLMAASGMMLLVACVNLAALLSARATARRKEILLRLAVGASRGRLVRQLLVEGALLSVLGAAAGLFVAYQGVRALVALAESGMTPIVAPIGPDARVLGFTAAVTFATTFLFALAPALRATRVDLSSGLKDDPTGRALLRRFTAGPVLASVQVALALVLIAGATLFTRSLANLRALPLGFNAHNLLLFDVAPGQNRYDETRGNQFYSQLRERLRQTRGVVGATLSFRLLTGYTSSDQITIDGQEKKAYTNLNFAGPDFFEVMGIPLVLGRGFDMRDLAPNRRVAVISESLARGSFGPGSPLGRRFRLSSDEKSDIEVIGVAKDAKYYKVRGKAPDVVYAPYTQCPWGWPQQMTFEVRYAGSAAEAITGVRQAVTEIDRTMPIMDLKTQQAQMNDTMLDERLFASLVSLFGAVTLLLACIGLYGLVAYSVTSRTREIGVRIALGAGAGSVVRLALGQVVVSVAAGLAIGLLATWALTRVIASHLYGVKPHDPGSLAFAGAVVVVVAMFAAWLPARRAAGIAPVEALRCE